MRAAKVAVTIDQELLSEVDTWVRHGEFPSRSGVVQVALARLREERARYGSLLGELAKLDPAEERLMADEWLGPEVDWQKS
jgi:Arc/MetJ-type ribon-helix-helix transcriptional regulator